MSISSFADFGFIKTIERALKELKHVTPTPIQIHSINPDQSNNDLQWSSERHPLILQEIEILKLL